MRTCVTTTSACAGLEAGDQHDRRAGTLRGNTTGQWAMPTPTARDQVEAPSAGATRQTSGFGPSFVRGNVILCPVKTGPRRAGRAGSPAFAGIGR